MKVSEFRSSLVNTMEPVSITAKTLSCALGIGVQATLDALLTGNSGLRRNDFAPCPLDTWIGRVEGVERVVLPKALAHYTCRNNQLAMLGLQQDDFLDSLEKIKNRYGAHRVGVIVGTSTSGIHETELAYQQIGGDGRLPDSYNYASTHNSYSLAGFLCTLLALTGPSMVISTACSSSAKVFAVAQRYLQADLCDAVLVGGVDSLCLTTLYGFNALQLVSRQPCMPFDQARDGISIGEAAGFALLQRQQDAPADIALLGFGESSDAYHMSSPHPDGLGAVMAMHKALQAAQLCADDIDYINLHGTATEANDAIEDTAVAKIFSDSTLCSSTKGWTGHTLGAAGIVEAVISGLCLQHGLIPGNLNTQHIDAGLRSSIVCENKLTPFDKVLSNSFGFGGNNCSLVFGRCRV